LGQTKVNEAKPVAGIQFFFPFQKKAGVKPDQGRAPGYGKMKRVEGRLEYMSKPFMV
jgi:hypothetical protein